MKKTYHQKDLKEKLILKAREVFEAESLKSVTVRRISKELEVSPMAFYHYFKDLSEFVDQIAVSYIKELDQISQEAVFDTEIGYPRLYKLGEAYIIYAIQNPKKFLLMFQPKNNSIFDIDWQKVDLYRILGQTVAEILPQNSSPQEIQVAAISAWSLVHGFAILVIDGPFSGLQKNPEMLKFMIDKVVKNISFG
jgi:AcrR family transcriptional regulator